MHTHTNAHACNVIFRTVFQVKLLTCSKLFKVTKQGSDRASIWTLLVWLPSFCLTPPKSKTKHLKNIANYIQIKDRILLPLLLTIFLDSATSHFHYHYPGPGQCNVSHYTGPLQWVTVALSTASLQFILNKVAVMLLYNALHISFFPKPAQWYVISHWMRTTILNMFSRF